MQALEAVTSLYAGAPESRRDLILRESAKLFYDKGFNRTTARDIAKAAGLLSGSIFYHFPSKAHILTEVIAEGMRYGEGVARAFVEAEQGGPADRFEALMRGHLTGLLGPESRYTHNVAIREWKHIPEDLRAPLRKGTESYRALWWEIMDALEAGGLLRVPRKVFYRFCTGGLNWTAQWCTDSDQHTIDELAKDYRTLLLCE